MDEKKKAPDIGIGIYLPEKVLTNEDLEARNIELPNGKLLKADRILEKIGVERRHIAEEHESVSDMGIKAAKQALGDSTADIILASSSHPTSYNISSEIKKGLNNNTAEFMDFHAACSGSALMFDYVFENNERFKGKKILVVASDKFAGTVVDLKYPEAFKLDSSMGQTIFGDGACAISFVLGKDIKVLNAKSAQLHSKSGAQDLILMAVGDNKFVEPCIVKPVAASEKTADFPKGYFTQNGPKVYEDVIDAVPDFIKKTVEDAGLKKSDIDLVVLHPGSKRMFEALSDKLSPDYKSYSEYSEANMSSVSLLYSFIMALKKDLIERGDKVVLCGFGAGSPNLYGSVAVVEIE